MNTGEGARYGWCTDHNGKCELITEIMELHNNSVVALLAWNQFKYTQDRKLLFPVIKEAVEFMLTYAVTEKDGKAYIMKCEGVDESTRNHTCNDSWTVGATIAALSALIEAARELKVELPGNYSSILQKLYLGLKDNHDKNGVLRSSLNAKSASVGSMIYLALPEYPSAAKTMEDLWNKQGEDYSLCQIGVPRQDTRNVPLFHAWAASV